MTMTREEAIKHFETWLNEKMWRCFGEEDRKAIRMAIEALTDRPHGRLIDADALIAEINTKVYDINQKESEYGIALHSGEIATTYSELIRLVMNAPTVSAEAEPTVIRSRTFMPTKDFKEWAKRIREVNPNAVVIPCDAEVASAEAVQGWIPFTCRPMTEEEQGDYPNCTFIFDCDLPDDGDEILVSNGRFVWMDTFCNDIDGCYLDSGDDIDEDMAWMPLPTPYKGGDTE